MKTIECIQAVQNDGWLSVRLKAVGLLQQNGDLKAAI
jgi:hypothetical protein